MTANISRRILWIRESVKKSFFKGSSNGTPGKIRSLKSKIKLKVKKMFWLTQIMYKMVVCCTKVSFLILFLRIFPYSNKIFRYANFGVMTLVVFYTIASVITTIVQCLPVPRVYDKSIEGTCINLTAFWYANAVHSILTDILIIVIPCLLCYRLQTSKKDKFGLYLVFGVGLL
jgi:hypothetical protein